MTAEQSPKRRGRGARRAERGAQSFVKFPYINRNVPLTNLLSDEALEMIEANADQILEEVGMEFRRDEEALAMWRAAGADVKGERVHIPKGLARELCKTAPSQFTHHARNPERSVQIGGDAMVFAPIAGAPFARDLDNGRRYGTLEDMQKFDKLAHMSPAIHHAGYSSCEPVDVAVNKRHMDIVYSKLRYTDMPTCGGVGHPQRVEDSISMAKIVFGDEFVDNNVVLLGNCNVNSPLVLDDSMLASAKAYARANQATIITPAVLAGAMGPVTATGCIAQLLAECLGGIAFVQLVNPGAPVIFGGFIGSVAMQTGAPTFGTPEASHALFANAQLARRMNVPIRIGGALCASKIPDAQAAYESANSLFATVLSGANLIMHSAGWLEGGLSASFEKYVMDADQLAMMQKFASGLDISEKAQALDAIREVGPGGHFLGCQHTQDNHQSAFHESAIADYTSLEQWEAEGALNTEQRANRVWKKMLENYQLPPMDESIDEALKEFIKRRKDSMPDALE